MNVGDRIRSIRKSKCLTQIEVAEKSKISVNSVRNYEAGKRHPNLEQLRAIANALEVSVFSLIEATDYANTDLGNDLKNRIIQKILTAVSSDGALSTSECYDSLLSGKAYILVLTDDLDKRLFDEYQKLNKTGQEEAVKRISELATLLQYLDPSKYTYVYEYPPEEDSKENKQKPPQD